jgi:hypothetical protein
MVSDLKLVVIRLVFRKHDAKPTEPVHVLTLFYVKCKINVKFVSHPHKFACCHAVFHI